MPIIKLFLSLWNRATPQVRNRIVIILSSLIIVNIAIWVVSLFLAQTHPLFLGLIALAYGLGLRHAVDADHIAAIDNTTRKLMLDGKKPAAVGLFFSLGHSTIVIVLSILVAISTSFVKNNLPEFQAVGTIIGTSISSFFLLLIGFINLIAFINILRTFRSVTNGTTKQQSIDHDHLHVNGFLARFFNPLLRSIHSSYQMYFVGFLFGLGFDTASEVGLLSISAASGVSGIPIWEILLLPMAFTAGMALIDTLDGILMLGAYGWATIKPIRKLYYNLNITLISVIIALFIGGVEAIQLLSDHLELHGRFYDIVNTINLEKLGYLTILAFVLSWTISIVIYNFKGYDHLT
ncbi:HoxN/HupN/NixA family nickel/cobalt transporter [soil metagenome]